MDAQQFLVEFGHIASAPNGVQRLREMVLQLAVMGRLVEHNTQDGDVEKELLSAQIERAIRKDINGRKSSKNEELNRIAESPYPIPSHWRWVALGDLALYIQRGKGPNYADRGQIQVISQKCVQWTGFDPSPARWIDDRSIDAYSDERFLQPNDLLWNSTGTGTVGRIAVFPGFKDKKMVADSHVTVMRPTRCLSSRYLWCLIASPGVQVRVHPSHKNPIVSGTTNQVELSTSIVRALPIPLPPLAEQKRIVAKVDELMALCDKLEALQNQRKAARAVLTKEILGRVASDATVDAQTCLQNFSLLVSDVEQIPVLRQTILSLAVQGKLVDLNDVNWKRAVLGDVVELISGQHLLPNQHNAIGRGIPYLTGPSDFGNVSPVATRWTENPKVRAMPGDILVTVKGSGVGKTNLLIDQETAISRQLMAVRVRDADRDFIHLALKRSASHFQDLMTGIAIPGIGRSDVLGLPVILPPLAEQKRIVSKVNELMALCDALETKLRKANQVQEQLAISSIAALTGIHSQEKETMKAPKTELVARLKIGKKPSAKDQAPLAAILIRKKGGIDAKELWQHSGMERIDDFYHQLKFEMNQGWIVQPETPSVRVVGDR